tara:strand:- start:51925 stop:52314 length:390 start_codon:yes stop_codon:yes gene_type:complete
MEEQMEALQELFGGEIDLAALASGAGLFGGGASTMLVAAFSGAVKRFIIRTLTTAALTGVGFLFLLNALGFEIVPPEDLQEQFPFGQNALPPGSSGFDGGSVQEKANRSATPDETKKVYVMKSPFRKDG